MVNAHVRMSVIGGSIAVLLLVAVFSMAMAASVSTTMFLVALAVAPGIVIALLTESASPSVAEILRRNDVKRSSAMKIPVVIAAAGAGLVLSTHTLSAQTGAHYRDFQLGSTLASVAAATGVAATQAKTVHDRPAVVRELPWHRPYAVSDRSTTIDPVQEIVFSFYNDQLFRLVIDYDHDRTLGMTDTDLIEAISTMYGPVVKSPPVSSADANQEAGTRVARWGDGEYQAVLYRMSYASGFRLLVTSVRLSALARTADAQAARLDAREAPQRERARQKQEADAARALQEKARLANKATFVP